MINKIKEYAIWIVGGAVILVAALYKFLGMISDETHDELVRIDTDIKHNNSKQKAVANELNKIKESKKKAKESTNEKLAEIEKERAEAPTQTAKQLGIAEEEF